MDFWEFLLQLVAYYIILVAVFAVLVNLASLIYMLVFINKEPPKEHPRYKEGVSILKPLCGIDPNLVENFQALSRIDYPKFEVIFCIEDPKDMVRILAEEFIDNYPEIDARIATGSDESVVNGKVRNLLNGYKVMKYDLFWISDARVKVSPNSLKDLVFRMTDDTGMVHSMPSTVRERPRTLGGVMEKLSFGCTIARVSCGADLLGMPGSIGMSILMRKSFLDSHCQEGLKDFSNYMAEDHHMAKLVLQKGLRMKLSSLQSLQNSGRITVAKHTARMQRWTKLRFFTSPMGVALFEVAYHRCTSGILLAWSLWHLYSCGFLQSLLLHTITWFVLDYTLLLPTEGFMWVKWHRFLVAWLLNHVLPIYYWMTVFTSPIFVWKSRKYRLHLDGTYNLVH